MTTKLSDEHNQAKTRLLLCFKLTAQELKTTLLLLKTTGQMGKIREMEQLHPCVSGSTMSVMHQIAQFHTLAYLQYKIDWFKIDTKQAYRAIQMNETADERKPVAKI